MGTLMFVTGGARSGKSTFAERLAATSGRAVVYIATMEAGDAELEERIAKHRSSRPTTWTTVESPRNVAEAAAAASADACILLDCLSLWVTNRMLDELGESPTPADATRIETQVAGETQALLAIIRERSGQAIVVTNEVGTGVVPPYPLGRVYRDLLGRINQQVSTAADRAWLLVAGRALELPPTDIAT